MTAAACSDDAVEQAAMVVGVEARRRVVDRQRADDASLNISGQTSADCSFVRSTRSAAAFEIGAGPRVLTMRAAIAAPTQPLAVARTSRPWNGLGPAPVAKRQRETPSASS